MLRGSNVAGFLPKKSYLEQWLEVSRGGEGEWVLGVHPTSVVSISSVYVLHFGSSVVKVQSLTQSLLSIFSSSLVPRE